MLPAPLLSVWRRETRGRREGRIKKIKRFWFDKRRNEEAFDGQIRESLKMSGWVGG